jgi:HPt (histidine-containing phosphotransfer) domain-containing protein
VLNVTKTRENQEPLAKYLLKNKFANKSVYGRQMTHTQQQALIQFAESQTGSKDSNVIMGEMDLAQQLFASSGGRVDPRNLLLFTKQLKSSKIGMTRNALYTAEPFIQEFGGQRAATAYLMFYRSLIGGHATKSQVEFLRKLGLTRDKDLSYNKYSGLFDLGVGAIKGSSELQENAYKWVIDYLKPSLIKAGFKDLKSQSQAVSKMFSNQNAAGFASDTLMMEEKIQAAIKANKKADITDSLFLKAMNLPSGKVEALNASVERMETAFGKLISPSVSQGMDKLTNLINKLANALEFLNTPAQPGPTAPDVKEKMRAGNISTIEIIKNRLRPQDTINTSAPSQTVQLNTQVNLDGKKVGEAVTHHLVKEGSKPPSGTTAYNPGLNPTYPAYNGR